MHAGATRATVVHLVHRYQLPPPPPPLACLLLLSPVTLCRMRTGVSNLLHGPVGRFPGLPSAALRVQLAPWREAARGSRGPAAHPAGAKSHSAFYMCTA